MSKRIARLIATSVAAVTLSACAATPASTTADGTSAPPQGVRTLEGQRAKEYRSIAELKRDAVAVVVATPTGTTRVETIGMIPFTVSEMRVDDVVRGDAPAVIQLRQTGDPQNRREGVELVAEGQSYLIFLAKFHLVPGDDTGQYHPVGMMPGLYARDGENFRRTDGESRALPARLRREDAR